MEKHNRNAFRNKILFSSEFTKSDIAKKIIETTKFLPVETQLQYRVKAILLDIKDNNKCVVCGKIAAINNSFALSDSFFYSFLQ